MIAWELDNRGRKRYTYYHLVDSASRSNQLAIIVMCEGALLLAVKDSKPNLLWLSLMAPYDKVAHASGKIQNFYLKKLNETDLFRIKLVSLCKEEECNSLDLNDYGIDNEILVRKRKGILAFIYRAFAWISKYYIWNRYAGLTPVDIYRAMNKELYRLSEQGYEPDIIVLEWTEILFLLPLIKQLFPNARLVSIEEDVSFLGQERRAAYVKNGLIKKLLLEKSRRVKQLELKYLQECDLVILNNFKDRDLLEQNGINKELWVWTPFFQSFLSVQRKETNKDLLFYGAMSREENWRSVEWFIENVFSKIDDLEVRLLIAGSNPNQRIQRYASERIRILGFVDDIAALFQKSLCLVAPLVLGAGIKIKVLEGFSAGIPVLTNEIGIEGIAARDGRDYFFCKTAEEYLEVIQKLINQEIDARSYGQNAKKLIAENYNFEEDASIFAEKLNKLH